MEASVPIAQVLSCRGGAGSLPGPRWGAVPLMGGQGGLAALWWLLPRVTEGPVAAKQKWGVDLWPGSQQPRNPSDILGGVGRGTRSEQEQSEAFSHR